MPLDPYSPCPGGTGKKVKFCCADLIGDLERIEQLTEGQQYAAALAEVERLDQHHPGKPCLLSHKVRLELATKKFPEAAATTAGFLEAFPENPVALAQAAVTEAIVGKTQEAFALFDKARDLARAGGEEMPPDVIRAGQTLVQAASQTGHPGAAQGIIEWLADASLGTEEERQVLAAIVGSAGVPPALRTKPAFEPPPADSPFAFEFEAALKAVAAWRLSKALSTFRSLKAVAGDSPELFANIAILCEMLARPFEAAEAWHTVARLRSAAVDDAVEATGRAIALETEADPDRSPVVRITSQVAPLSLSGTDATGGIELLEDKLRHDGRLEATPFDRSAWVSRGAVPPHSAWRLYSSPAAAQPERLLASLMIFGRQTDREPEAVLQGFEPDMAEARPAVEALLGCTFLPLAEADRAQLPGTSPTAWLLGTQFRVRPGDLTQEPVRPDGPSPVDRLLAQQREALRERFVSQWPDTHLPELLGQTPRQAVAAPGTAASLRVEALVSEGEATARQPEPSAAWTALRQRLGLPTPAPIRSERPFQDVSPLRWHRLELDGLPLEQLRAILVTSIDAGFERAATRAAEAIVARPDAGPEDRWEAYGLLEERAATSLEKLEIIGKLRELAKQLRVGDGMLDVAELRVRLSRADEAGIMRLLTHLQREHARDQKVIAALAEVLAEAGIDLAGLAARSAAGAMPVGAPAGMPVGTQPAAAADQSRIWTPGGDQPGGGGEKKSLWTPG